MVEQIPAALLTHGFADRTACLVAVALVARVPHRHLVAREPMHAREHAEPHEFLRRGHEVELRRRGLHVHARRGRGRVIADLDVTRSGVRRPKPGAPEVAWMGRHAAGDVARPAGLTRHGFRGGMGIPRRRATARARATLISIGSVLGARVGAGCRAFHARTAAGSATTRPSRTETGSGSCSRSAYRRAAPSEQPSAAAMPAHRCSHPSLVSGRRSSDFRTRAFVMSSTGLDSRVSSFFRRASLRGRRASMSSSLISDDGARGARRCVRSTSSPRGSTGFPLPARAASIPDQAVSSRTASLGSRGARARSC